MVKQTFTQGLGAGLFVGLLVGLVIGIEWCLSLGGYRAIDMVVENGVGVLTRDGAFMGSLTLVGLVLFGSTILIRAFGVNRSDSKKQNIGSLMVIGATLFLGIFYTHYAFWYPNSFPNSWMYAGSVGSFVVFVIGAAMVGMTPKGKG